MKLLEGGKTPSLYKVARAALFVLLLAMPAMADVPEQWYKTQNGLYMCYTDGNLSGPWYGTWNRITNHVTEMYANGFRAIDLFAVYRGNRNIFYGLGPIDYYTPQTQAGTEAQFDTMIATAHAQGMAVCSWLELCYSSPTHGYWIQAQNDKHDGLDTPYSRSFKWRSTSGSGWAYSSIAGYYYKKIWNQPGFDWASADWRAEAANIVAHWLGKGLDGMVFDAYNLGDNNWGVLNGTNARCRPNVQDQWTAAGKFIVPEGILDGSDADIAIGPGSDYGFTHVYDVTCVGSAGCSEKGSWNNDYYDAGTLFITNGINPENHFQTTIDTARGLGGGTFGYDPEETSDNIRPCAFAIMTTAGVIEELYFSYSNFNATCTAKFHDILNVVNSHPALEPRATRLGCPCSTDGYAHVKTSAYGCAKALCIFNRSSSSNAITVDLSGAGLAIPQTPTNLMTGAPAPEITSANYTVTVEESDNYGGFLLLDVAPACMHNLAGDMNDDCRVDSADFARLGAGWQIPYDTLDLKEMAANWLTDCCANPADPACIPK